jgi:hypothetical protein
MTEPKPVYAPAVPRIVAWLIDCHHCGTEFRARRRDARLCSGRCRTAAARLGGVPERSALESSDDAEETLKD